MTASLAPIGLLSFRSLGKMPSSTVIRNEATLTEQVPPWFDAVVRTCAAFVELERDWDSYGARPVHESIARAAGDLLLQLVRPSVPAPTVVPTPSGGIQLEWHTPSVDLEIELASAGRLSAIFEDRSTGQEWERQFESDLGLLVSAVGRLSETR